MQPHVVWFMLCLLAQNEPMQHATEEPGEYRLVFFHATWCGPCQTMKGHLKSGDYKRALKKNNIAHVHQVDVDQVPESVKQYAIETMPTWCLIRTRSDGKADVLKRFSGYMSKDQLVKFMEPPEPD